MIIRWSWSLIRRWLSCFLFWLRGLRRRIRIGFLIFFITSYQNLYKTMNVHDAYGFVLVPETIKGFFKQRTRWWIGVLQSLKANKKLLSFKSSPSILFLFFNHSSNSNNMLFPFHIEKNNLELFKDILNSKQTLTEHQPCPNLSTAYLQKCQ